MQATVIGAGLAGSEAAWQLARRGVGVTLREMKPRKMSPAHSSEYFAELVCSNSLRGAGLENAVGLLKEELRRLDSVILRAADATRVEAGGALAVDRFGFSAYVTKAIRTHPNITVAEGEAAQLPEGPVIVATGPLTSDALAAHLTDLTGGTALHFFDAAAPLVSFESIDLSRAWFASRYGKGTADYVNCALEKEEYQAFWRELCAAEEAEVHGFEDKRVFEGFAASDAHEPMVVPYTEVVHGDYEMPMYPFSDYKYGSFPPKEEEKNVVFVYDRGTLMDTLANVRGSYIWTCSTHPILMETYGLVERRCDAPPVQGIDAVVISKKSPVTQEMQDFVNLLLEKCGLPPLSRKRGGRR